jgi:TPR repeat protein
VNFKAAVYWYRLAAQAGDPKAQFNLALSYRDGDGVRHSQRQAKYWFRRASQLGHRRARALLKDLSG